MEFVESCGTLDEVLERCENFQRVMEMFEEHCKEIV